MSQIDNILIQIRGRLNAQSIKLWLEPYYLDEIGCIETEIDKLADEFSKELGIPRAKCKIALTELQDGALRKLKARKEYEETGLATFTVRQVKNREGTARIMEIKCPISSLGFELQQKVAEKLGFCDARQVKCISSGKILDPDKPLLQQGVKNNQQLMAIVSEIDRSESNSKEAMYDRIRKIKMDVEAIVNSKNQLFEMEDQDGNPVFMPPEENRSLLMAMGFTEKARAAILREQYDEALLLLLEADEKFSNCNSRFLEKIDNYALVNLDIVWCYLCLKNVTQLPDAERRLDICEKSFERSYGPNMSRLIALKGSACPERALLMRLHLLQGVVLFHQNCRNEAYEKFIMASSELKELKVDDDAVASLVEMGYEPFEARLGLRAAGGNLERAVNYIHENKKTIDENRKRARKERRINRNLAVENDKNWVNPRSVCTLMEMGFARDVVVEALKLSKNNLTKALDLLQTNSDELRRNLPSPKEANNTFLQQLQQLGFEADLSRVALETTNNDLQKAIDFLIKVFGNEEELQGAMQRMTDAATRILDADTPSTSRGSSSMPINNSLLQEAMSKMQEEMESLKAYQRFGEDITDTEHGYLDLPLIREEQILAEYKQLLEQ